MAGTYCVYYTKHDRRDIILILQYLQVLNDIIITCVRRYTGAGRYFLMPRKRDNNNFYDYWYCNTY